ncbi:hypothetical protein [Hyalangium rubrum]|uniref:Lipoprotein n=1 Tax=Hyalangium rubrum TaxID=3103134 RepID=A0ABU5GY04_9BACT|nr:hypothetical protein [Hyalangium sp. s54d21]MDY7225373.1 hypothetical protein [Hyalangium sp. s54d21]
MKKRLLCLTAVTLWMSACNESDPIDPPVNPPAFECKPTPVTTEDVASCQPAATDYRPREPQVNNGPTDAWAACISDDNTYHPINQNISTVARSAAYDEIAGLLWRDCQTPSKENFVTALDKFTQPEGIASRVQRREDYHYPAAPNGGRCRDAGVPETAPDRCVGPSKLLPIINDAFTKGANGEQPRVQAARIEAALLWFFYISPYSEVNSCTSAPQDCDSAWAYYTGGSARGTPVGLAAIVRDVGPATHERAYDAALAVRCWRNLDNETGAASNLELRNRAMAQYDRALLRGVALVLRQRFTQLPQGTEEDQQTRLAFINTLAPFLDREARARNASQAEVLRTQSSSASASAVDVAAATAAIDALFSCP